MLRRSLFQKSILFALFLVFATIFALSNMQSIVSAGPSYLDLNTTLVNYEGQYDSYTNSDLLLNNSIYSITDYANLFASNIDFTFTTKTIFIDEDREDFDQDIHLNVFADDPIVSIIPKVFFVHRGTYLYIGREYGFFVKTTEGTSIFNNDIDVFVFDIDIDTDYSSVLHPSQIIYTIKPLFQNKYRLITNLNSYSDSRFTISVPDNQEAFVIPYPNSMYITLPYINFETGIYGMSTTRWIEYPEINDYYIQNPIFATEVFNENQLNQNDTGYQKFDDNGTFIYASSIEYQGLIESNSTSQIWPAIKLIAGFTPLKNLVKAISLGQIAFNVYSDYNNNFTSPSNQYSNEVISNYSSKVQQLTYTPAQQLNKVSLVTVSSTDEKKLMFGVVNSNDFIKVRVKVGMTDLWRTHIYSAIGMQITYGKNAIQIEKSRVFEDIEGSTIRKITTLGNSTTGYTLSQGVETFEYTPVFTSSYHLSVPSTHQIKIIQSNNYVVTNSTSNSVNAYLYAGSTYYIEVKSNSSSEDSIALLIDAPNFISGSSYPLNPYGGQLHKIVAQTTGIIKLSHNYTNVQLIVYDSNLNIVKSSPSNHIYVNVSQGNTYYVRSSSSSSSQINGYMYYGSVSNIPIDTEINISSYSYGEYRRFTAPTDGSYKILLGYSKSVGIQIVGDNFSPSYTVSSSSEISIYSIDLSQGQSISLGYDGVSGSGNAFSFKISKDEVSPTWIVNNSVLTGNLLYMKQSEVLNVRVRVGVKEFSNVSLTLLDNTLAYESGPRQFTIRANAFIVQNPIQIAFVSLNGTGSQPEIRVLNVRVLPNVSLSFGANTSNLSSAGIQWYAYSNNPTDCFKPSGYFIFANGQTQNFSITSCSQGGYISAPSVSLNLENLIVQAVVNYVRFEQSNGTATYSDNIYNTLSPSYPNSVYNFSTPTMSINTLFASGSGTVSSPFIISNARHLNNIRYATSTYYDGEYQQYFSVIEKHFKLNNSIALSNNWTPIQTTFTGSLSTTSGSKMTISNINISQTTYLSHVGFFSRIQGGSITNIILSGSYQYLSSSSNGASIGSFAGEVTSGSISNSESFVSITSTNRYSIVGGLVGNLNAGSISSSYNFGSITTKGDAGGIAAHTMSSSSITNSYNYGNITVQYWGQVTNDIYNASIGGIVGKQYSGTISSSSNYGLITYSISATENGRYNTDNRLLKPRIGQILGYKVGGNTPSNCQANWVIDTTNLSSSYLYWFHSAVNQKVYVNTIVGRS